MKSNTYIIGIAGASGSGKTTFAQNLAKKFTKASLASIGSQIGKRDHATVLHACKTVDNLSSTDKQFRKYVEDLGKKLSI